MEQVLLFGEASPEILLLLRARVKRSDLFGSRGKLTRTSVHVSTLWLRIWSKGHRFLAEPMTSAAETIATWLAAPSSRVSSEGRPKMPLPITALITSAVIVQRPIERMKDTHFPLRRRESNTSRCLAGENRRLHQPTAIMQGT